MATSESQKKATQKYLAEHMEPIRVWVSKGHKKPVIEFARQKGMSMADYIKTLIKTDMEREGHPLE